MKKLIIARRHLPNMYYHIVEEKNRYGMIISNIVTLIDQITCCEQKGISDQL